MAHLIERAKADREKKNEYNGMSRLEEAKLAKKESVDLEMERRMMWRKNVEMGITGTRYLKKWNPIKERYVYEILKEKPSTSSTPEPFNVTFQGTNAAGDAYAI